ncbi:tau tubulin kinase 1 [Echinococcus multilocularis]|uniref:Tau tubulin kinase 1 n=1 Tax=Echinococcus multilocularis TaxID=6211 RepID=A0A068XTI0_ECHMU|nr:tau tubulin kinase 1 [Echinococcus multilocularis]
MPDQFNRLNVRTAEKGPLSGGSNKRAGIQRKFSEDGLESADSGNYSGHSERGSVPDNYVVAVKAESNTQSKQMLHMEVAVLRRLKGRKNFCDLITCAQLVKDFHSRWLQGTFSTSTSSLKTHSPVDITLEIEMIKKPFTSKQFRM